MVVGSQCVVLVRDTVWFRRDMCGFTLLKEVTVGRHLEDMIWLRNMIALLDETVRDGSSRKERASNIFGRRGVSALQQDSVKSQRA
jgi:hypothetical protein